MTQHERLQMVRDQTELNHKNFALSIGLSPSGYHTMLARKSEISQVLANSVELIHGIRADWLLNGDEPMNADRAARLPFYQWLLLDLHRHAYGTPGELLAVESLLLDSFWRRDSIRLDFLVHDLAKLEDGRNRMESRHEKRWHLERELRQTFREFLDVVAVKDESTRKDALTTLLIIHMREITLSSPPVSAKQPQEMEEKFIAQVIAIRKQMKLLCELSDEELQILRNRKEETRIMEEHGNPD